MKVFILGQGDVSGEWEVVGVYASRELAEAAARATPGFKVIPAIPEINMPERWRCGSYGDWLHISEYEVLDKVLSKGGI